MSTRFYRHEPGVAAIIRKQFSIAPGAEGALLITLAGPLERAGYCETAQLLRTLARHVSRDPADFPQDLRDAAEPQKE